MTPPARSAPGSATPSCGSYRNGGSSRFAVVSDSAAEFCSGCGFQIDLLLPRIGDITEVRTPGRTGEHYYEVSRADTVWPEHGSPHSETNVYTVGYRLTLREQVVYSEVTWG